MKSPVAICILANLMCKFFSRYDQNAGRVTIRSYRDPFWQRSGFDTCTCGTGAGVHSLRSFLNQRMLKLAHGVSYSLPLDNPLVLRPNPIHRISPTNPPGKKLTKDQNVANSARPDHLPHHHLVLWKYKNPEQIGNLTVLVFEIAYPFQPLQQ
jgi:hypothetical protein